MAADSPTPARAQAAHPAEILLDAQAGAVSIPVCDHYSGVESRMRKSLALQAELTEEFGTCVFDVTLDCEDGAPVGGEAEHAALVTELALGAPATARVGARVHPVSHPAFIGDVLTIAGRAGHRLSHLMLPKVDTVSAVHEAVAALDAAGAESLPIHVLIESPLAVHHAFEIAAHPRVQSLSFGLMDFVSSHGGAIGSEAMSLEGQFSHPLVVRAKLEIASAAHAHGKVPAHGVVTEFKQLDAVRNAARRAQAEFGFTRMWSIHPSQIRPIIEALAPDERQVELATRILLAAQDQDWAPVSVDGVLQDRASYRHYWQLLTRAHATGRTLPPPARAWFGA